MGVCLSVCVDDIKKWEAEKKRPETHVGHTVDDKLISGNEHLCQIKYYLACTQRECKPNLKIVQESKDLLESLISEGFVKQSPGWERSHADTIAWSSDMEGHA